MVVTVMRSVVSVEDIALITLDAVAAEAAVTEITLRWDETEPLGVGMAVGSLVGLMFVVMMHRDQCSVTV